MPKRITGRYGWCLQAPITLSELESIEAFAKEKGISNAGVVRMALGLLLGVDVIRPGKNRPKSGAYKLRGDIFNSVQSGESIKQVAARLSFSVGAVRAALQAYRREHNIERPIRAKSDYNKRICAEIAAEEAFTMADSARRSMRVVGEHGPEAAAAVLGVSRQRVGQIVHYAKELAASRL